MWLGSITGVFTYFCNFFQLKKLEKKRHEKKNQKNQWRNFEKVKDSIIIEEIVNEDIEETAKSVKIPDKAVEAVNDMKKKY